MANPDTKRKPGPKPERLRIEDPEDALRKLLSTPPPTQDREPAKGDAEEPEEPEES